MPTTSSITMDCGSFSLKNLRDRLVEIKPIINIKINMNNLKKIFTGAKSSHNTKVVRLVTVPGKNLTLPI